MSDLMGFVELPRWVYADKSLSDVELQTRWVVGARERVRRLEAAGVTGYELAQAQEFLADAEAALRRHKRRVEATIVETASVGRAPERLTGGRPLIEFLPDEVDDTKATP